MKKLAVICQKGLDNFLDWTGELNKHPDFIVTKYIVTSVEDIDAALQCCDIAWFEWCNEVALHGTEMLNNVDMAKAYSKVKAVVRLHRYEAFTQIPAQIKWENVSRLILVNSHMKHVLIEMAPGLADKVQIETVYNGLDIDNIEFLNPDSGYDIALVGFINMRKNQGMAIQILNELVKMDKRYKLHIAGASQDLCYEMYLKKMVKDLGLKEHVVFYGQLNKEQMNDFWKGKSYILSTSIHEAHPYNIMEGMARGLTPVIHNFCGAGELYFDTFLFSSAKEAVDNIQGKYNLPHCHCTSEENRFFRSHVTNMGWTLDHQVAEFARILSEV